jgi:uncharacterized membrane protein YdbT with pleckstrin-like domain
MKNIKDTCIEFLKNEDIKRDFKEIIKPVVSIIYNEMYIYVWFICIYNVFLIFIILANLFLLLRLIRNNNFIPVNENKIFI